MSPSEKPASATGTARVPFNQRPEWSDITPLELDDGPNAVVPIAYREGFSETMAYFRAIYLADERSPRSLSLTTEAIYMNPANYTVWHFRRLVLDSMNMDLHEELPFIYGLAKKFPKNYQIWHHRRCIAEKLGSDIVETELMFTEKMLSLDAKNYHAWSHRQWVLQSLGGWEDELEYCDKLIREDVFNNSAWNQRYFVVTRSPFLSGLEGMRDREIEYTAEAIRARPDNESPWRYLMGLYGDDKSVIDDPRMTALCLQVLQSENDPVFALSTLLDLIALGLHPDQVIEDAVKGHRMAGSCNTNLIGTICSLLARIDPIRANYWKWQESAIFSSCSNQNT